MPNYNPQVSLLPRVPETIPLPMFVLPSLRVHRHPPCGRQQCAHRWLTISSPTSPRQGFGSPMAGTSSVLQNSSTSQKTNQSQRGRETPGSFRGFDFFHRKQAGHHQSRAFCPFFAPDRFLPTALAVWAGADGRWQLPPEAAAAGLGGRCRPLLRRPGQSG